MIMTQTAGTTQFK
ncbi:hypothetical protein A2U01_0111926, partial [Trifolium medium]|nr:hypothetical protein [Trifolium medium]